MKVVPGNPDRDWRWAGRMAAGQDRPAGNRDGLSLLEVILAIAILGGAMAAIGVCVRVGTQAALDARELTMAQLLCESKLAEISSGLLPAMAVSETPVEVAPDWLYSVDVQPGLQDGMLLVAVTVQRDPQYSSRPVGVTLFRWLIDPEVVAERSSLGVPATGQSGAGTTGNSSTSSSGGTSNG
ncbi:MAG: hypothetical protein KatS3mg110_0346 [Pirellulaceae bacterium]|nr:MAG: hypothetical protein KatS3mg110_0346 [Pirellulaceae bacterium]